MSWTQPELAERGQLGAGQHGPALNSLLGWKGSRDTAGTSGCRSWEEEPSSTWANRRSLHPILTPAAREHISSLGFAKAERLKREAKGC